MCNECCIRSATVSMVITTTVETIVGMTPGLTVSSVDGRYTLIYVLVSSTIVSVHCHVCWYVCNWCPIPGIGKSGDSVVPGSVIASVTAVSSTGRESSTWSCSFALTSPDEVTSAVAAGSAANSASVRPSKDDYYYYYGYGYDYGYYYYGYVYDVDYVFDVEKVGCVLSWDNNSCVVHSYASVDVSMLAPVTAVSSVGCSHGRARSDLATGTAGVSATSCRLRGSPWDSGVASSDHADEDEDSLDEAWVVTENEYDETTDSYTR